MNTLTLFTIIGAIIGGLIAWFFITPLTFEEEEQEIITDEDVKKVEIERFQQFQWFDNTKE